jgi:uncharacterized protein YjbI with pentapeptide repeats
MHSRDPDKDKRAFQIEFDRILSKAGEAKHADFTGFVFLDANFQERIFKAKCIFKDAIFKCPALFWSATFVEDVDFTGCAFEDEVKFTNCTFKKSAKFGSSTGRFMKGARFDFARFERFVRFVAGDVQNDSASFEGASFAEGCTFTHSNFHCGANFKYAKFSGPADFRLTEFEGATTFELARFAETVSFYRTAFSTTSQVKSEPAVKFWRTCFAHPESVRFELTDLARASFLSCDISHVVFSVVTWPQSKGRSMVFDESMLLRGETPGSDEARATADRGIIDIYHQLKCNYDDRGDPWTAGDFHYREMDIRRIRPGSLGKKAPWISRRLGLLAWYRYASCYGESYLRPLGWLLVILLLFMLLYPLCGLTPMQETAPKSSAEVSKVEVAGGQLPITYRGYYKFITSRSWGRLKFFGNSLMTALDVAAFREKFRYQPIYPWGQLLSRLEVVLTSTLLALFLLAVRRQAKR